MNSFCRMMISTVMMLVISASLSPAGLARSRPQVKTDPQVVAKLAQILERSGYLYKNEILSPEMTFGRYQL